MVGLAVDWIYAISFYALAFCAVISALVVISARSPVISALWLVVCFISVAGIYALLKAHFLAMVQILVYAGAIMVLFVMIIMLMDTEELGPGTKGQRLLRVFSAPFGMAVLAILVILSSQMFRVRIVTGSEVPVGTIEKIGQVLFTKYLLPFEVLSLLLLGAVVAVIYLARRRGKEGE